MIIELDPGFPWAHANLGSANFQQRRDEEAIAEMRKAIDLSGRPSQFLSTLGYFYAAAQRRAEALRILKELEERYTRREAMGVYVAVVYAGLGDKRPGVFLAGKRFSAAQRTVATD